MKHKDIKEKTLFSELVRMIVRLTIAGMLSLSVILLVFFTNNSFQKSKNDLNFYMGYVQEQFGRRLHFLEEISNYFRENQQVYGFFENNRTSKEKLEEEIRKEINLYSDSNLINEFNPIVTDLYIVNNYKDLAGINFYPLSEKERSSLEQKILHFYEYYQTQNLKYGCQIRGNALDICFPIYDNDMQVIGHGIASLEQDNIKSIFEPLKKFDTYCWEILDENGRYLFGKRLKAVGEEQLKQESGEVRNGLRIYNYQRSPHSFGLSVMVAIPKSMLYSEINQMLFVGCGTLVLVSAAIIIVITHLTKRFTEPVQNIVRKIRKVGEGNFKITLEHEEFWELEEISSAFNETTHKIDKLIKEVYEVQIAARDLKIQYIQTQMNPHFMFNVLAMLGMRLKMEHNEELYKVVTAFSSLMRGKIFKENELEITLDEEIKLAEFYLYIQSQRFGNMINYHITWKKDSLKECLVPRLCVEPFVENAVIHGIVPKGTNGDIYIDIHQNDNFLEISVEDNGIGFDVESTKSKSESKDSEHPGVGMKNIENLIHILYGQEYGVNISSVLNKGTKVEVVLPYRPKDKEESEDTVHVESGDC